MTIFGLEPVDGLPEGWTPLEAIVAVKCLDEEGEVAIHTTATAALNSWEALGMLHDARLRLEGGLSGD